MPGEDHDSTIVFADLAIGRIKVLHQAAHPPNYEVWYNYEAGLYPAVNKILNDLITAGSITQSDLDRIHAEYFSPFGRSERIDGAASKFMQQIGLVMQVIDKAADTASRNTESLEQVRTELTSADSREALRVIVESLARTALTMEENNRALEVQLKVSKQEIEELHINLAAVRGESLTDPLTQLANRKCFDTAFAAATLDAETTTAPLSVMMADIDHFKLFNDAYGHITGDQVLRLVGLAFKQNVKGQDVPARFGGEEFAVLLPGTSLREATTIAEHIRRAVMGKELMRRSTGENLGRITLSIGVASLRRGESGASLLERADLCLYAAKRSGRNRVITEADPEISPARQAHVA